MSVSKVSDPLIFVPSSPVVAELKVRIPIIPQAYYFRSLHGRIKWIHGSNPVPTFLGKIVMFDVNGISVAHCVNPK